MTFPQINLPNTYRALSQKNLIVRKLGEHRIDDSLANISDGRAQHRFQLIQNVQPTLVDKLVGALAQRFVAVEQILEIHP